MLAPHIGSATMKARDGMARTVAENVIAVLEGREPPNRGRSEPARSPLRRRGSVRKTASQSGEETPKP